MRCRSFGHFEGGSSEGKQRESGRPPECLLYRTEVFAEDLAATLLEDLVGACEPQEMRVDLTQQVRGGLQIRTVVCKRREE